jgi:hypothetical protein
MIVIAITGWALAATVAYRRQKSTLALQAAATDYNRARLKRRVSETALSEYAEGIHKSRMTAVEGEIALAESDWKRASLWLAGSKRLRAKGRISADQLASDLQTAGHAKLKLDLARHKRTALEMTAKQEFKALRTELNRANANETAKRAAWDQLKAAGTRFLW